MSTPYERIKLLIEQSGLSYQELEKKTGVKKSSLQRYASRTTIKIPLDVIEKLAKAFNVSEGYLMGLDVPMERKTVGIINQKIIAKNIKTFRENAKMSQIEFANLLGVDEVTVFNIESGNHIPSKEMIFRICDIFKITPDFLNGTIEELFENGDTDAEYRLLRQQQPLVTTESELTEGERILIELFRKLPDEAQKMYFEVLRTSLKSQS